MTTVFKAEEIIKISGYERECDCSHCGRPLKVGVRVAGFMGAFGADCLAKAFAPRVYMGKKYKLDGARIRELAIIAGKGADCMYRHNVNEYHLTMTLAKELRSI